MGIGKILRVLVLGTLASALGCSSGSPAAEEDLAEVSVALKVIPGDVGCFVLKANPAGAVQPLELDVSVVAGKAAAFTMGGIPSGQVTFSAQAFAGSCPVAASASPTWVSQPSTITVTSGITTPLSVSMTRPGQVAVSVDFATSCPSGQVACTRSDGNPGTCQPTSAFQTDPKNCGACGFTCSNNQACIAGVCSAPNACPTGQIACLKVTGAPGPCVPISSLQTDKSNCGACGITCSNAQACVAGVCTTTNTCPTGQVACVSVSGAPGSCMPVSNLQTDKNNCGACGITCSNTQSCVAGACATTNACAAGQIACLNVTGAPGVCMPISNLQSDRNNCGSCGKVCPNAQSCVSGACK